MLGSLAVGELGTVGGLVVAFWCVVDCWPFMAVKCVRYWLTVGCIVVGGLGMGYSMF